MALTPRVYLPGSRSAHDVIDVETSVTIVDNSDEEDRTVKMYTTLGWDKKNGFIKTWAQMRRVENHNGRATPAPHVVKGAPPPEYLYGTPQIVANARQRLCDHGIDPDERRSNGVIAREVVLSASPEFFAAGSEADQTARLSKWKAAQVPFLKEQLGEHRLVSVVMHTDEKTPHVHAIVLALKYFPERQRGHEWRLAGEVIGATGKWAQHHTVYARAMAPFGLSRGRENSDNKHKPYQEHITELDAERNGYLVAQQEIASRQAAIDQAIVHLADGWARLRDASEKAREEKREAESAKAAAISLLEDAMETEAEARASERRLEHGFDLLRQQQASADAREADLEKRERALRASTTPGIGRASNANYQARMTAPPAAGVGL